MHLSPDELVDLAEGSRPESSAPHLAGCAVCRAQLNDLRAMMSAVADVEVPEPSPLFWDHFSQRVHDAVGADAGPGNWRSALAAFGGARAFQAGVIVALALIVAVLVTSRTKAPDTRLAPAIADAGSRDLWTDGAAPDADADPSLTLVASLTAGMDLESASEAGLARDDTAEHAVTHMSDTELRELQKLLKEEMARPGA